MTTHSYRTAGLAKLMSDVSTTPYANNLSACNCSHCGQRLIRIRRRSVDRLHGEL
jgi:hypothetical protein